MQFLESSDKMAFAKVSFYTLMKENLFMIEKKYLTVI